MTEPTAPVTTQQGRSVPVEGIVARYREELAATREQLWVAQAIGAAAEAECAQLRLRVIELEQPGDEPQRR